MACLIWLVQLHRRRWPPLSCSGSSRGLSSKSRKTFKRRYSTTVLAMTTALRMTLVCWCSNQRWQIRSRRHPRKTPPMSIAADPCRRLQKMKSNSTMWRWTRQSSRWTSGRDRQATAVSQGKRALEGSSWTGNGCASSLTLRRSSHACRTKRWRTGPSCKYKCSNANTLIETNRIWSYQFIINSSYFKSI